MSTKKTRSVPKATLRKRPTRSTRAKKVPKEKKEEDLEDQKIREDQNKPQASSSSTPFVVDYNIKQWGYTVIRRISIQNLEGETRTYLKVRSPLGFFVFVEVDHPSYASESEHDVSLKESSEPTTISETIRRGAIQTFARTNAVITCKDGMCKLERQKGKVDLQEHHYKGDESTSFEDSIRAYPIVKLSELKENPGEVLELTHQATANNLADQNKQVESSNEQMIKSVNLFMETAAVYVPLRLERMQEMSEVLGRLSQEQKELLMVEEPTSDQRRRMNILSYNLGRLNDRVQMYFEMKPHLEHIVSEIQTLQQELNGLVDVFNVEFDNLEKMFDPPTL